MAKKKKTQLKPVARPFSTLSIPKKVIPEPEDETPTLETAAQPPFPINPDASSSLNGVAEVLPSGVSTMSLNEANGVGGIGGVSGSGTGSGTTSKDEFDPQKVEEQSLQDLVDRLQEKTEREITRTLKGVEFDRRLSKTFPRLDMDPILRNRVFKLVEEEENERKGEDVPLLDENQDKVLLRVGVSYGVLMRLGFAAEKVEECLRASKTFELDEAFNWLLLNCSEEELDLDKAEPSEPLSLRTPGPQTPRTPRSFQAVQSQLLDSRRNQVPPIPSPAKRPSFVAQSSQTSITSISTLDPQANEFKSRILEQYSQDPSDSISSVQDDSDSSDVDPNAEYARLKLNIFRRSMKGPPSDADHAADSLDEKRMEEIRKHYFFDQKDAEAQFRTQKSAFTASALEARLRDTTSSAPSVPSASSAPVPSPRKAKADKKRRPPTLESVPSTPVSKAPPTTNLLDDEGSISEHSEGGIFGTMLDEMPTSETDATGTVVHIRDMALPKHFAGRTPRVVLTETVNKMDKYAAVSFYPVGGASRAARAGVTIRWGRGKVQEWQMTDEACYDERQAEQYVATLALHALTFVALPGFASASATGGAQTYFRMLPPVYRDLWDELENKRKGEEDAANRNVWSMLRDLVEPRVGSVASKMTSRIIKNPQMETSFVSQGPKEMSEEASNSLAASFRARQESPAYQEMRLQRNTLPIAAYRQTIVDTLESSQVMVLSGETGCGKSTQLPSFLLEDQLSRGKPCRIFCTEPRRISAISLAQRVSRELGEAPGAVGTTASLVGYSIRLESNTTRNTRLAFVTNGIALRMLEGGSGSGGKGTAFDEITHIIIDEVHERSIESDFLLIVLKSLMEVRKDLKVVLMSATLDAEKISQFFGGCPVLHVPGRTFPVDIRFLEDAVEFTQWTIKENSQYAKRLNDRFHRNGKQQTMEWNEDSATQDDDDDDSDPSATPSKFEPRYSQSTVNTINLLDERHVPYELIMKLLERICFEDAQYLPYSAAVLIFMPGINEIRRMNDLLSEHQVFGQDEFFRIYPLHSTMSSESQGAVFDIPPLGVRKIVIATNIAETGITIPDITCVIDSGKHREMRFDEKRQISRLVETFIAKSNAAQRRGRAGRVQSGICFHLFTKSRHDNQLAEHPLPEMMRLSLSDLALRIKILKVKIGNSIEDVLSRALDPPSQINVQRAVSALVEVRALTPSEEITPMGRLLSKLPTDVHLGKFLLMATLLGCLDPALTIAATLNSKSPFITPFGFEQEADRAKNSFKTDDSDFMTIHNAFASWRRASANPSFVRTFCRKNYLSFQNLQQIEELRQQFLSYLIDASFIQVDKAYQRELSRVRYSRNKTRFIAVPEALDRNSSNESYIKSALVSGLYPKILVIDPQSGQLRTLSNNQPAAFHPSSVNFQRRPKDFGVNHLCYFTIMHSKKLYAWETGPVDDLSMLLLCGDADFKLNSDSIIIDRKIKFAVSPKTNVALKYLRERIASIIAVMMRGSKALTPIQQQWFELTLLVLGKIKVEASEDSDGGLTIAAPAQISVIY